MPGGLLKYEVVFFNTLQKQQREKLLSSKAGKTIHPHSWKSNNTIWMCKEKKPKRSLFITHWKIWWKKENEEQNNIPTDNETTPETKIKILTHRYRLQGKTAK